MNQFVSPNKSSFMASFKTEFKQVLDRSGLRNSRHASEASQNSNINLKA